MADLNISEAARATGKDRNTIKRYLKNGKLSGSKNASGKVVINAAELVRVFGELVGTGELDAPDAPPEKAPDSPESTTMHQTVEILLAQLKEAKEREEWLKEQLEQEQERYKRLENRMLPPGEPQEEAAKKGLFARLFGR